MVELLREKIRSVECIGSFDDEYVYDIGINDENPYFFGNSVLLHNSCYFTVSPVKEELEKNGFILNKESFVELSDNIAETVNGTFAQYLKDDFNVPMENGKIIKCAREICATSGLWLKKKRYACLYYDKDGLRVDTDGKDGKVKIMGIETQRSDTPKWVQEKLKKMIEIVLVTKDDKLVLDYIKKTRREFGELPPWEKGTPRRVNNLAHFKKAYDNNGILDGKKIMIPNHVKAALNYNVLRDLMNDKDSLAVTNSQKIIVCSLKKNSYKMDHIAIPIDQLRIPQWFKDLPFDDIDMVEKTIDKKVGNIVGVLGWDLDKTKESEMMEETFVWG